MGVLIAMHYPTKLFAKQADHTYVKCGTSKCAWKCWGGKTGGKVLRRGSGSTKQADAIAGPDEKAGIKCYLINGVCHQAANRTLFPARITVRGARGYSISEALFGTYGRVGVWPCKSPFRKHSGVTGDLRKCVMPAAATKKLEAMAPTAEDKFDWRYVEGVLGIYDEARPMMEARAVKAADAQRLHMKLFMYMADYNLGPMLNRPLSKRLGLIRARTEKAQLRLERNIAGGEMSAEEIVKAYNKVTDDFQHWMANVLTRGQYQALFDLKPGETVWLADPDIVAKTFAEAR